MKDVTASIGVWSRQSGTVVANAVNELGEPEELGKILSGLFSSRKDALCAAIYGIFCDRDPETVSVFCDIESYVRSSGTDFSYLYDGTSWYFVKRNSKEFRDLNYFLLTNKHG